MPFTFKLRTARYDQVLINGVTALGGAVSVPAMGLQGAAWATTLSRWFLLGFLLFFSRKPLRERGAFSGPLHKAGDWRRAARFVRQGLPIGGQMLAEFGAFAAMGLIAGRCGTTAAAGHAIIQCLTDLSYVLPLGIGALGSVQVGQGVGGGRGVRPSPTALPFHRQKSLSLAACVCL